MAEFLYQKLNGIEEAEMLQEIPAYVRTGLSDRFDIREYQESAFRRFITYYNTPALRKNKQLHLLFHMATGSGKTLMMAGLVVYLYKQGYRNFLFFVNMTNIIEKTKANFLNSASSKYLFAENILIDGEHIPIKEVTNFQEADDKSINLCFMSTQKLHLDLFMPQENGITIADFEDKKIVLLSDEAHHVNTDTKKGKKSKGEEDEERSWEYTVNNVFRANKDNVLLEFTATCDLKNPNVEAKYVDKIIFDYPLAKFRESKYTKDFYNFQSDVDVWNRTIQALLLSQYRLKLFQKHGHNVKPVILLKSQKIEESKRFFNEFHTKLQRLSGADIACFDNDSSSIVSRMFKFFDENGITHDALAEELKQDFSEEHSIIMNSKDDAVANKQISVNSLEEPNNPYRLIFTVDMLNEGWDVLNLFDIVRLYETRQSSGSRISTYTIKEAQLIGRGARYCPFQLDDEQERFKRKYDDDLENEMRVCETLYYHSKQDSKYIGELRKALTEIGLLADNSVEVEYVLKDSFISSNVYKTGYVFANRRVEKDRSTVYELPNTLRSQIYNISLASGRTSLYSLFDESEDKQDGPITHKQNVKIKDVDIAITNKAIRRFETLKFNVLKSHFPNLKSTEEFITNPNYLGDVQLTIQSPSESLTGYDLYAACMNVFQKIADAIGVIEKEFEGTKEFNAARLYDVVKNKKRYIENPHGAGEGISQNDRAVDSAIRLDLSGKDWYVFNDNFGTSEEKQFVAYFDSIVDKLKEVYTEVFLIRNERQMAIYSFDTGERFEPDYILFLKKQGEDGYEQQQIFVEPKGEHLLEKDEWKERFLLELQEKAIPSTTYADDNSYRIIGLPFFNAKVKNKEFRDALENLYLYDDSQALY